MTVLQSQLPFAGLSVLIVEDDSLIGLLMEDILVELGCRVVGPVDRPDAATVLIDTHRPDAALLDVSLSHGQNSYQTAAQLADYGVPFAFVTGLGGDQITPEWRHVPALTKPFSRKTLTEIVRRLADA